jgi:AraC-like DNA-binding protein
MDVLSDVLAVMRAGRPLARRAGCQAPWGMRFAAGDAAACHVVLQGACWLIPPHGAPLALGVGDVVLIPRGDAHALTDRPGGPPARHVSAQDQDAPLGELRIPGPGATTTLLCASYRFDHARPHPLLHDLPEVIHLPDRVGQHPSLRAAVELLGSELRQPRAGTEAVLPALVDLLLLYVLRAWLDEQSGRPAPGWAAALHDPALITALRHIHRRPEHPWTVVELATQAGLSRASFAKRFTTVVGQPPLTYLTWWRMTTAAGLLRDSDASLRSVAERCGYGSEYAFAKAFKREYGTAPGQYRRQERAGVARR